MGKVDCLLLSTPQNSFLDNHISPDFHEKIKLMLDAYHKLGCNMLLKIFSPYSHLNFSTENMSSVSDEQEIRYRQIQSLRALLR